MLSGQSLRSGESVTDALLLALGAQARKTERRARIHAELGYRLRAHSTRRAGARLRRLMVSQALAAAERRKLQPVATEPRKEDLWQAFVAEPLSPDAVGAQLELRARRAPQADPMGEPNLVPNLAPGLAAGENTPGDASLAGDAPQLESGRSASTPVDVLARLEVEAPAAERPDVGEQRPIDGEDVVLPSQADLELEPEPVTVVNTLLLDRISAYSRREPLAKLGARV